MKHNLKTFPKTTDYNPFNTQAYIEDCISWKRNIKKELQQYPTSGSHDATRLKKAILGENTNGAPRFKKGEK